MASNTNGENYDTARARLDTAMSRLASGADRTKDTIARAKTVSEEKTELAAKVGALEKENLSLHEQVSNLSIAPQPIDHSAALDTLTAEKSALEQRYALLKQEFTTVKNALHKDRVDTTDSLKGNQHISPEDAGMILGLKSENQRLREELAALKSERDIVRSKLDQTISHVESMTN